MALTNTAPASIPSMQRAISVLVLGSTRSSPARRWWRWRPSIAASTSGTRMTMATGPNISSWATGMSVVTPRQDGRREAPAVAVGDLRAGVHRGALPARLLDLADQLVALRLG